MRVLQSSLCTMQMFKIRASSLKYRETENNHGDKGNIMISQSTKVNNGNLEADTSRNCGFDSQSTKEA